MADLPESVEGEYLVGDDPLRLCTTHDLMILHKQANADDLNRSFTESWLTENLDPNGVHVLSPFLWHHHGKDTKQCHVFLKTKDSMEPVEGWLDVYPDVLDRLPTPPDSRETGVHNILEG